MEKNTGSCASMPEIRDRKWFWGGAQMLEMQLRVTDARQIIFPHPTVSEIIREVLWEFDDK